MPIADDTGAFVGSHAPTSIWRPLIDAGIVTSMAIVRFFFAKNRKNMLKSRANYSIISMV